MLKGLTFNPGIQETNDKERRNKCKRRTRKEKDYVNQKEKRNYFPLA